MYVTKTAKYTNTTNPPTQANPLIKLKPTPKINRTTADRNIQLKMLTLSKFLRNLSKPSNFAFRASPTSTKNILIETQKEVIF